MQIKLHGVKTCSTSKSTSESVSVSLSQLSRLSWRLLDASQSTAYYFLKGFTDRQMYRQYWDKLTSSHNVLLKNQTRKETGIVFMYMYSISLLESIQWSMTRLQQLQN